MLGISTTALALLLAAASTPRATPAPDKSLTDGGPTLLIAADPGDEDVAAWVKVVSAAGVPAKAAPDDFALANAKRLHDRKIDLGFMTSVVMMQAIDGSGWAESSRMPELRAVVPLAHLPLQVACLARSPVKKLADLRGKSVGVPPAGSTPEIVMSAAAAALGIQMKVVPMDMGSLLGALQSGRIDAAVGLGNDAIWSSAVSPVRLIPFSAAEQEKAIAALPYVDAGVVGAKAYPGQDEDVRSLSIWLLLGSTRDLPADTAKKIAAAFFAASSTLPDATPALRPGSFAVMPVPLHLGAVQLAKEHGIALGAKQLPPEAAPSPAPSPSGH